MTPRAASLYAVFGQPIHHSLSPQIHNAAFQALSLSHYYIPVLCDPTDLGAKLAAFLELGGLGVNLTRPLKETVIPSLVTATDWVKKAGAANTLWWTGQGWGGDNTDCLALWNAVPPALSGQRALVLGAGGVARATSAVLMERGYEVVVASRHPRQVDWISNVLPWEDRLQLTAASLVVNCTPLGQDGEAQEEEWPLPGSDGLVVDWVYRPRRTALIAKAQKHGLAVLDGLTLLVSQAAFSWQVWFSQVAPFDVMWNAVRPWQ